MSGFFSYVGARLGEVRTSSPIVGQAFQVVCVPDTGSHLLILEDPDTKMYLLGLVRQVVSGVPWVVQPTTVTPLQSIQGCDDDIPLRFSSPGRITVFVMKVDEEVVKEVESLNFLASCSAEDFLRWQGQETNVPYSFSCIVRPNEEVA
jgi:hypothetical protein